ncbi:MAG: CubicO group peptidase, beta-lactamase class C family [Chloroflexi bacterium AL-W]|nr:CubicO group peptidase, beta-lactamase class C family [Chloroflexi bacterium AL-N1]NOK65235.1 CubicO group peptidase, beta-lactamase class C family [Chloroflexi bacterium AL-N10]NOK72500.1 CubicO group peptidase, beta-lactamase class C family [Chloroflexi bacterium AL-N5]NOK79414.1 CubicO group peptidase, beta-lactamase class C family [Chloroflexi bacterium AL-W]NOK87330.1 CubicO group peptidase, beta-lactamase class C family [Chloroflexi bacterium AL-N15]
MYQAIVDDVLAPFLAKRQRIQIAVGIIHNGQTSVSGYATPHGEPIPSGHSLFEIGSITKVFTAVLLADLIFADQARLDESAHDVFPEPNNIPKEVTLQHLATHTSGLPRLPSNLFWSMLRNVDNPYSNYTQKHLNTYLRRYRHKHKHIGTYQYSNLGAGILGTMLAHQLDISYEEAIRTRISDRLGLDDTRITLSPEQTERLIPGYTAEGKPTPNWDMPTLAGAGALRSSADDMLCFLVANLDDTNDLMVMLQFCHAGRAHINQTDNQIGLGWHIKTLLEQQHTVLWHNGGTGGYRSYVGLIKQRETGVVILSNNGPGRQEQRNPSQSVDYIGEQILQRLMVEAPT